MTAHWETIPLILPDETEVEAKTPHIISASRSTDIPAFYAEWFFNRLTAGYLSWRNPFNGKSSYISFAKTRLIVFWSKNPRPILPYLKRLDERGIGYYFLFTLNHYDGTGLEPDVPLFEERVDTFRELSNLIGKERVLWRFDPAFLIRDRLELPALMERYRIAGDAVHPYTDKLIFSFAEISIYAKVRRNLNRVGTDYIEFNPELKREFAERLVELNRDWGLELASCAMNEDFQALGIHHNRCIDVRRVIQLFGDDRELIRFLNAEDYTGNEIDALARQLKDSGQRAECGCMISKDIGQYNTCPHFCVYCYANHLPAKIKVGYSRHNPHSLNIADNV